MSGADKFILHNGRAFSATPDGPRITQAEAVREIEIIRAHLRERFGFDDEESVSEIVLRLLASVPVDAPSAHGGPPMGEYDPAG